MPDIVTSGEESPRSERRIPVPGALRIEAQSIEDDPGRDGVRIALVAFVVVMSVAGGARRGDSPLAWDGDLDQWVSGGGEAATTEMRSTQGASLPNVQQGTFPHARTQAMRAATTRLQMALQDENTIAHTRRRFWMVTALAVGAATGLGFLVGRQRPLFSEPARRRIRPRSSP